MRIISELSLLTIVWFFLSHRAGTVNLMYGWVSLIYVFQIAEEIVEPATIIRIGLEVQIPDMLRFIERIGICSWKLIDCSKWPPVSAHTRGYDRNRLR